MVSVKIVPDVKLGEVKNKMGNKKKIKKAGNELLEVVCGDCKDSILRTVKEMHARNKPNWEINSKVNELTCDSCKKKMIKLMLEKGYDQIK